MTGLLHRQALNSEVGFSIAAKRRRDSAILVSHHPCSCRHGLTRGQSSGLRLDGRALFGTAAPSRIVIALRHRPSRVPVRLAVALCFSAALQPPGSGCNEITVVMKFGGSSVATAERMAEVADIVCSFPDQLPCVVLSAMGKSTNLLLAAGEAAVHTSPGDVPALAPLRALQALHRTAARELRVGPATEADAERLLNELQQLLVGIAIMQELTPRAKDSLVSFGERLATRLFAAHLRARGVPAAQHDAFDLGLITTDEFTAADVLYDAALPALRAALARPGDGGDNRARRAIPVVTGFLGRGQVTGAITTLGRGGSDLTATVLGAALGLPEVQVWKDVDGVLTCDPRIVAAARPVPLLTFEEATELAFFGATVLHPLAMQPALQSEGLNVRVKNSYNVRAPGTLIARRRDMAGALVTSIVLKSNVTLMDIVSTRMLGTPGFLAQVFGVFRDNGVSVDVVATSEISVSLTLDPSKVWERDLVEEELAALTGAFAGVARASAQRGMSILSLICNISRTSEILERVFRVLGSHNINVKMISQGASKTNISLIVCDSEAHTAVRALHAEFFEAPCPSRAAAAAGDVLMPIEKE